MRVGTIALVPDTSKLAARGPPTMLAEDAGAAPVALAEAPRSSSMALDTAAIVDALVGGEY